MYCNLVEHAILHILIAKKDVDENTRGNEFQAHGIGGYVNFIRPELVQWLIKEVEPKLPWQINCRNAIMMSVKDAEQLIKHMDDFLVENYPTSHDDIEKYTQDWFSIYGI